MTAQKNEITLSRYLAIGAFLTSIMVITGVSDPVNVPKMVVLATLAFGAFGVTLFSLKEYKTKLSRPLAISIVLFLVCSIWAVANSGSPFTENFYGTFGRNTGLLTYFSLAILCLVASTLQAKRSFELIIWGLIAAGFVNVVYCLWVIVFGDFIGWNNPYGNILGTFGNPNFIGAFLGIFISVFTAYLVSPNINWKVRSLGFLVIVAGLYEVKDSNAVQGIVVSAGGLGIVLFFLIRSRFQSKLLLTSYISIAGLLGFVAVMGALQKGPLTSLIYKTSVSLRGEYWQAAINMANTNPFTGVGMDSYGDWYRRARDSQALILPGPETVTNAAHNVPLDLLAYGGYPLFLSFLAILLISTISVIKIVKRSQRYNWISVALVVGWACYHVQSIISINQIGLAIWGWLLNGLVIAYERVTRQDLPDSLEQVKVRTRASKSSSSQIFSPQLVFALCAAVGFTVSYPAYNADYQFRNALKNSDLAQVEKALTSTYMTPSSSRFFVQAAGIFAGNNLPEYAQKYAQIAVKFNPNYFDAWRVLYNIPNTSESDKQLAKKNMIRLDPLNVEWKKLT
jgi:O-antigen ligase